MNTMTKRLAQMTALYAAKKVWNRVDQDAAMAMMGRMYRSTPRDWELAAKKAAGEGFDTVRSQASSRAMMGLDDVLDQLGLMRRSQVPSRRMSSMGMGALGGVALTLAGGYLLFGTEAGASLRQRIEDMLGGDSLESAEHNMSGTTEIQDPDALDKPSAVAAEHMPSGPLN